MKSESHRDHDRAPRPRIGAPTPRAVQVIAALRSRGDAARAREWDRMSGKLATLDASQRAAVEMLLDSIVDRLLHPPTVRIEHATPEITDSYTDVLESLFDLDLPREITTDAGGSPGRPSHPSGAG